MQKPYDEGRSFVASEEVLFQEVNDEMVLLDLSSENYFGLDEMGTRIWMLLNEGKSERQILDVLADDYEVERETLEKDVGELLGKLVEAGLITPIDAG
jgi:hypothetical protein